MYFGDDDSLVAEVIDNTTSRGRTLRFLYDGSMKNSEKIDRTWRNSIQI
jgi:S-adenosylmethionine:tRNA ribosyltransferase-isomerase